MILTDWLRELTPMDIEDLEFLLRSGRPGPSPDSWRQTGKKGISLQRVGRYPSVPGHIRSVAAAEKPSWPCTFLEEIDTGIHPARLALLLELIERQTAKG